MQKFEIDIKFIDTNGWQELAWYNSGGTRAKKVLQDLDGNEYYFKCSEKKPAKDGKPEKHYKFEFWNEVIAYQIGKQLGLNILRYDIAVFEGEIGCISPKMTVTDEEQLLEIGRFMTSIDPGFLPEEYSTRNKYSFQLLEETLNFFKIHKYWNFIIETLLFDSLIGNTDRHQENWAFIGKNTMLSQTLNLFEAEAKEKGFHKLNWIIRRLYKRIFDNEKNELNAIGKQIILETLNITKTAPIYDSGSSLARELTDNRVSFLLTNENELFKYIEFGKSELHWEGNKISHYQLIEKLLDSSYMEQVKLSSFFLDNWREDIIYQILNELDAEIPEEWREYCIPENRKRLIFKLLSLRHKNLKEILSARI